MNFCIHFSFKELIQSTTINSSNTMLINKQHKLILTGYENITVQNPTDPHDKILVCWPPDHRISTHLWYKNWNFGALFLWRDTFFSLIQGGGLLVLTHVMWQIFLTSNGRSHPLWGIDGKWHWRSVGGSEGRGGRGNWDWFVK